MTAKVKCIKIKKKRKESKRATKNRWRAYLKFEDNSIFTLNQVTFENSLSRNYFLKIFKKYYRTSYRPFLFIKYLIWDQTRNIIYYYFSNRTQKNKHDNVIL